MDTTNESPPITLEMLREVFIREHNGPNPYYKCLKCGEIVPGLKEYLEKHYASHL